MRVDISAFIRPNTQVLARTSGPENFVLEFSGNNGGGDDVTLYFDSLSELKRVADVILALEAGRAAFDERK